MRCLHCDGKLPLYRKITHGQFCSTAHRKAYWQEQERLAVERLHQTHNTLKAYRLAVPPESILGPAVPQETGLGGFVPPTAVLPRQASPRIVSADPLEYEMERSPGKPLWIALPNPVRGVLGAGFIRLWHVWFGSGHARFGPSPGSLVAKTGSENLTWRPVALTPALPSNDAAVPVICRRSSWPG